MRRWLTLFLGALSRELCFQNDVSVFLKGKSGDMRPFWGRFFGIFSGFLFLFIFFLQTFCKLIRWLDVVSQNKKKVSCWRNLIGQVGQTDKNNK